jgi:hypothetical protein
MNAFDQSGRHHWHQPLIDVADTMFACKKWLEGHDVAFTAANLLTMTRLVLQRERSIREGESAL